MECPVKQSRWARQLTCCPSIELHPRWSRKSACVDACWMRNVMSAVEPIAKKPVRVLIAEDSATQAERLKYVLERNGYQVTSTMNGRQALEAAKTNKPTLVISDIMMPEMNGYQLCHQIKSDPQLNDIPV